MPESLLVRFDALVARRGLAKNRSEVIRDLVRDALIDEECSMPGEEVMGTLTIVFNHHTGDVRDKLDGIQHEFFEQIVSSMHVSHYPARRKRPDSNHLKYYPGHKGRDARASHHDLDGTWHLRQSAHAGHRRRECCARLRARPSAYPRP